MDKGTASADEGGEDENEKWEGPTVKERVWAYCSAFIATIFVIVGELLSEQDVWGVVLIGGGLVVLNVLITSSSLEKVNVVEGAIAEDDMEDEDWTSREGLSSRQQASEMMSIDIDELSSEEKDHKSLEYSEEEGERLGFPEHVLHHRDSCDRRRYLAVTAEEMQARRVLRPQKRTRTSRSEEGDDVERRKAGRGKSVEASEHKRRPYKGKRERCDRVEQRDRYRERDKRERRSRDPRRKKAKRVRIAAGPTEDIIIGEV